MIAITGSKLVSLIMDLDSSGNFVDNERLKCCLRTTNAKRLALENTIPYAGDHINQYYAFLSVD